MTVLLLSVFGLLLSERHYLAGQLIAANTADGKCIYSRLRSAYATRKAFLGKKISFSLQGVSKGERAQTSLSFLGGALLQKYLSFFHPLLFCFFFQESGFSCWSEIPDKFEVVFCSFI